MHAQEGTGTMHQPLVDTDLLGQHIGYGPTQRFWIDADLSTGRLLFCSTGPRSRVRCIIGLGQQTQKTQNDIVNMV